MRNMQDGDTHLTVEAIEDTALREIVRRLVETFDPLAIYLFGSRARGQAGADSDYDVLVLVEASDQPGYRRAQRAHEALWGLWVAADVFVLTRDEFDQRRGVPTTLPAVVLSDGKMLYAA
jgi:predicted nucleotidyltransferase